jgi:ParB family chromosome partitioning protein
MKIGRIQPDPLQPRKDIDPEEVRQLTASFKLHGQLQPIVVEWQPGLGAWIILEGEKRWMAAQAAGMDRIACVFLHKEMPAAERLEKQLVANCLRSDLKPIERANAYRRLMDLTGWTQRQLADRLQVSQASVAKALALLEYPPAIQEGIVAGTIPPSAAAELVKLPPGEQADAASKVAGGTMTREDVAQAVKKKKGGSFAQKANRTVTCKLKGCKGTLVFRKTPGDKEIRAALCEWLATLPDEKQAAA